MVNNFCVNICYINKIKNTQSLYRDQNTIVVDSIFLILIHNTFFLVEGIFLNECLNMVGIISTILEQIVSSVLCYILKFCKILTSFIPLVFYYNHVKVKSLFINGLQLLLNIFLQIFFLNLG